VDAVTVGDRAGSRVVIAPEGWAGWAALPEVMIVP
jgi:hypothetical protein